MYAICSIYDLRIKDTLGSAILFSVERLSSSRRLKVKTTAMGKGSRSVSLVERLSSSLRLKVKTTYCHGNQLQKCVLYWEVVPFSEGP